MLLLLLPTTSVLKQREVPATVSSFYVFLLSFTLRCFGRLLLLLLLAASISDCDASVMVVGCAAVETGCMLEKCMKVVTKDVFIFFFWSRCCCCYCCVLLLLPTTSVLKRRQAADELERPSRTVHRVLDCSIAEHA